MSPNIAGNNPRRPEVGLLARVRQRDYLIEEVIDPPNGGDATLVTLSCVEQDAQGKRIQVLWELEPEAYVKNSDRWHGLGSRPFDNPEYFAAYLNTLRWNCVTATDASLFQAPFRAGIKIENYQLEPLRKALRLPRVNLFIADDVGLGKTIEAGLIARELLLRKKVRTIIVACPPSMLDQWQQELQFRFGLRFEILDRDYVAKIRFDRGFGVNPWTTHPRLLVSHRLLIDESYTSGLRDHLGTLLPGSLLILDEAHHAAPASGQKYAIDTKITKNIRDLAKRFEHRLFLSATPHNGHSNSFSTLMSLLDNQRFTPGLPVNPKMTEPVLVRRLKEDLRKVGCEFPERKVEQIDIDKISPEAPELTLATLLDEYASAREKRLAGETEKTKAASGLLICHLQQRLLSSVAAFSRTLQVHRRGVEKAWSPDSAPKYWMPATIPLALSAPDADDDRAELAEDDEQKESDRRLAVVSEASAGNSSGQGAQVARERELLNRMQAIADSNRAVPDARIRYLCDWIKKNCLKEDGREWGDRRLIIFTEWEDTLNYLKGQISHAVEDTAEAHERVAVFRGFTSRADRERLRDSFNAPPDQDPLRILIATDAAREGLNLQAHCNQLFHFDIPWNPARLEQRNGRIDRKLQESPVVYCYYFVYLQRPEDRVLNAIVKKTERIRKELGSTTQVIEPRLESLLKRGIKRSEADEFAQAVTDVDIDKEHREAIDAEMESARRREVELRQDLQQLESIKEKSQRDIRFDHHHFRATLDCALRLNGCDPLKPLGRPSLKEPERFMIPALEEQAGSGWQDLTDTLREKRNRGENVYDWRRTASIRPVVFEDPGKVTNEVVQFHLEHPVVQRLLQRFLSQGFVHDDLSRTCIAHSRDAVKRVALLGRLALYGPEASRLHEELIFITARWTDSEIRQEPLKPYERETELRTINLLFDSLLEGPHRSLPDVVLSQLQRSAPTDVAQLWSHLEERAQEFEMAARRALQKRGDDEATAMKAILELQQKQIEAQQIKTAQMSFEGMEEEDKRQREAERKFQNERLKALPAELETEPERIRSLYSVRGSRLEPVGLIYLWPVGA